MLYAQKSAGVPSTVMTEGDGYAVSAGAAAAGIAAISDASSAKINKILFILIIPFKNICHMSKLYVNYMLKLYICQGTDKEFLTDKAFEQNLRPPAYFE